MQNLERRDLIGLNTILAIVALCTIGILVGAINRQAAALDLTAAPAARLEVHCGFIRLQLAEELDWLADRNSQQKQMMAQLQFDHYEADGWRGVELCAPQGVQIARGCVAGDVACMTAVTAEATLMTMPGGR